MPFELPDVFAPRAKNRVLTLSTEKIYTRRLNSLSKDDMGNNPEELRKNYKKVIKYLKDMNDDSETSKIKIRGILTAILWVQPQAYREKSNAYYKYYQNVLPGKNDKNGEAWKPRTQYESESE